MLGVRGINLIPKHVELRHHILPGQVPVRPVSKVQTWLAYEALNSSNQAIQAGGSVIAQLLLIQVIASSDFERRKEACCLADPVWDRLVIWLEG